MYIGNYSEAPLLISGNIYSCGSRLEDARRLLVRSAKIRRLMTAPSIARFCDQRCVRWLAMDMTARTNGGRPNVRFRCTISL